MRACMIVTASVAAVLAGSVPFPGPAVAEVVVLESTVSAIKKGARFEDDVKINIPRGRSVRMLLPSGASRRISGPYEGPANPTIAGAPSTVPSFGQSLKSTAESGGASNKGIGASPKVVTTKPPSPPVLGTRPVITPRQPIIAPGAIRK